MHIGTHAVRRRFCAALAGLLLAAPAAAQAQKKYDVGASDTEIKVGNFGPYSGPVAAYGTIGRTYAAYFRKINEEGGVNGRKINLISLDDAYNPAQSVEQTRKLVERDRVLLLFGTLGTSHNQAILRYVNQRKIPHLFIASGAARWGNYQENPWTMGWQPTYDLESRTFAEHILATRAQAKIGILVQNDDFGKDNLEGFLKGLGDKAKTMVVSQQSYEITDPTIDSQMVALKNSGADTFINLTTPKFAAQAIRKAAEIGWKPVHYMSSVSGSITQVMQPAGVENAMGVMTSSYLIDPSDPQFKDSQEVKDYLAFMQKYYPEGDPNDGLNTSSYARAISLVELLKQCGDDLTRANIMKQAANLDLQLPMIYPDIRFKTAPDDFYPLENVRLVRFDGARFVPVE